MDVPRVVVRDRGAPAGADALRAVHEDHGYHRAVPLRLDALAVVLQVVQHEIVVGVVDEARQGAQARVDVARRRAVLATVQARTELP